MLYRGPAAPASPGPHVLPTTASRGHHLPWRLPPCTAIPYSLIRGLFRKASDGGSALDRCVASVEPFLSEPLLNLPPCLDSGGLFSPFPPAIGDRIPGEMCFLFGCYILEPPFARHICGSPLVPHFGFFPRLGRLVFSCALLIFSN